MRKWRLGNLSKVSELVGDQASVWTQVVSSPRDGYLNNCIYYNYIHGPLEKHADTKIQIN